MKPCGQALESGEIDLYWEYTATGWLVHLSETDSIPDPQEQYEAVARQDLRGERHKVARIPRQVTTLRHSREREDQQGPRGRDHLGPEAPGRGTSRGGDAVPQQRRRFQEPFDGLPGLERAYGFEFSGGELDRDVRRRGLRRHRRGRDLQLRRGFHDERLYHGSSICSLLEDDKEFFAVYNPALTVRQDVYKQYPQLRKIFTPISKELDTETLRKLNYAVDVQDKSPERVARTWLRENDFIE